MHLITHMAPITTQTTSSTLSSLQQNYRRLQRHVFIRFLCNSLNHLQVLHVMTKLASFLAPRYIALRCHRVLVGVLSAEIDAVAKTRNTADFGHPDLEGPKQQLQHTTDNDGNFSLIPDCLILIATLCHDLTPDADAQKEVFLEHELFRCLRNLLQLSGPRCGVAAECVGIFGDALLVASSICRNNKRYKKRFGKEIGVHLVVSFVG